ncbi:hypothetical protein [Altererythrobacter sp. Root672]|uniref:hypothetical protein n=1 Tax=Altererythrobacter sp. Root672 TaxID=1736584 RepID=UPI0012E3B75C|nr:hypothetical protein [Altererythrobacter sp. Root672]
MNDVALIAVDHANPPTSEGNESVKRRDSLDLTIESDERRCVVFRNRKHWAPSNEAKGTYRDVPLHWADYLVRINCNFKFVDGEIWPHVDSHPAENKSRFSHFAELYVTFIVAGAAYQQWRTVILSVSD